MKSLKNWLILVTLSAVCMARSYAEPFEYSSDGTEVTDLATGLTWRRCVEGMVWTVGASAASSTCLGTANTYTHEAALKQASFIAVSTNKEWRLPNVKELASIVNTDRFSPAVDTTVFPATPTDFFWASTPNVAKPSSAWTVYFLNGTVGEITRAGSYGVRLVRDSP